jgi:SAM-dependent methyltransferase
MKRKHWIEISDEPWCPRSIRHAVTDYCRFVTELSGIYNAVAPLLIDALEQTGDRLVLDLGSGAAGPWLRLQPLLRKMGMDVTVCLSDHNPDMVAFERARRLSRHAIVYNAEPVDATHVPSGLPGFRTMFSAFHHLDPNQARAALTDAVAQAEGIAVFEMGGQRSILMLLAVLPVPFRVLLAVPFIRPFRWLTLLWTYLVPVLPLVLLLDSITSMLRIYNTDELRELTTGLDDYLWSIGTVRSKPIPFPVVYLVGVPKVVREVSGNNRSTSWLQKSEVAPPPPESPPPN